MEENDLLIGHSQDFGAMTGTLGGYDTILTSVEDLRDSMMAVCINTLRCCYDQMMIYWKNKGLRTWIIEGIESTTKRLLALLA